jgi:SAM-dependent methyltransferase/uncharacterized protein YbaR (Trm112 family)
MKKHPTVKSPQSIQAKAAEVRFRRDLCRYRVEGESLFQDEYNRDQMVTIFRRRMAQTVSDIGSLPEVHSVQYCLEVGAECCQRAAAVQQELGVKSYACDISLESLSAIANYASLLRVESFPERVCCDLEVLPFPTAAFDLVFSYETMHHFIDPRPIFSEIRRVTRKTYVGVEEPTKRRLRLGLGQKRLSMYHPAELAKSDLRKFIEEILWDRRCNEVEYGVIENEGIAFEEWKQALEEWFDCEWFWGRCINSGETLSFTALQSLRWLATAFLGGTIISWIARVPTGERSVIRPAVICPDCLQRENLESPLNDAGTQLHCTVCRQRYPIVNGVSVLLPSALRERLYPNI